VRPARYLFVCTANINRSPVAAAWAERAFAEQFVAVEVKSAGTHAWPGMEAGAYTVDAMRELGVDLRAHRTTRLDGDLLRWADHVLVMEPGHAEICTQLAPEVEPRIAGLWAWLGEEWQFVPDPHGEALDVHRANVRLIGDAVRKMAAAHVAARRAARAAAQQAP
jgi:protein-tyrosine-phosphatase